MSGLEERERAHHAAGVEAEEGIRRQGSETRDGLLQKPGRESKWGRRRGAELACRFKGLRRESKGVVRSRRLPRASRPFAGNGWSFQGTHKANAHPTGFPNKGKTGAAGGH